LIALNLSEGQTPPSLNYAHQKSKVVDLLGKLEMEIAQLPPDESRIFLDEYGITEPA
jgi:hypothetical protein